MEAEYTAVPATELREHGSELMNRVAFGGEELVLTRRGKPLVALVSLEALAKLHALEEQADLADARAAREDARLHGTVSFADVKAKLDS
jgi:prevent-host-death family protein